MPDILLVWTYAVVDWDLESDDPTPPFEAIPDCVWATRQAALDAASAEHRKFWDGCEGDGLDYEPLRWSDDAGPPAGSASAIDPLNDSTTWRVVPIKMIAE